MILYNTLLLYLCITLYYYINNMKKTELFSFRTTEQNMNYLQLLAKIDDRSQGYILNKMIDAFRERGCFTVSQIK